MYNYLAARPPEELVLFFFEFWWRFYDMDLTLDLILQFAKSIGADETAVRMAVAKWEEEGAIYSSVNGHLDLLPSLIF